MRIEAEFLELPIPFGVGITQAFNIHAAGRCPSTAALTSCGARNANECVRLICRTVHRSRHAGCSASVAAPEMISSSQRRPRAMALTRRARRSARSGRMFSRGVPCVMIPREVAP
jgi:hypothetical protein